MPRRPARAWGSVDSGKCRRAIDLRNQRSRKRTRLLDGERNIPCRAKTRVVRESDGGGEPGMYGRFLHGNRDIRTAPTPVASGGWEVLMKGKTRQINAQADRKSDSAIVPKKSPNKEVPASAEVMEGRALTERNAGKDAACLTQGWTLASYGLEGVRQRAKADKSLCL